jgi:hypothetical protein
MNDQQPISHQYCCLCSISEETDVKKFVIIVEERTKATAMAMALRIIDNSFEYFDNCEIIKCILCNKISTDLVMIEDNFITDWF